MDEHVEHGGESLGLEAAHTRQDFLLDGREGARPVWRHMGSQCQCQQARKRIEFA